MLGIAFSNAANNPRGGEGVLEEYMMSYGSHRPPRPRRTVSSVLSNVRSWQRLLLDPKSRHFLAGIDYHSISRYNSLASVIIYRWPRGATGA